MSPSLQKLMELEMLHSQAWCAFRQAPTPRLGSVLKSIESQMKYQRRRIREGKR